MRKILRQDVEPVRVYALLEEIEAELYVVGCRGRMQLLAEQHCLGGKVSYPGEHHCFFAVHIAPMPPPRPLAKLC